MDYAEFITAKQRQVHPFGRDCDPGEVHPFLHPWWSEVTRWELTEYPTRREALDAETLAIRSERPKYNGHLNDQNEDRVRAVHKPWVRPRGRCPECGSTQALLGGSYGAPTLARHNRALYGTTGEISEYGRCPGSGKPEGAV
jgi:hypothetical protein